MPQAERSAQAVIFLHGVGGAARGFAPQLSSFAAAGFAPVALDLPGYGARPAITDMQFDAVAADVEDAIARSGLTRPVLTGHSLGGMVAQTLLRRRPDGYAAAVLCCTSPAFGNPGGDFQTKFVADRLAPLDSGKTMAELAAGIIDEIVGPKPDPKGRALAVDCMAAVPAETYRAAVRCLVGFDERGNLGAIRTPVLCLAGEHDRNSPPAMMERMAGRIPGARYVCLPGVGHLPNLETPAAFDAAVFEFLHDALKAGS
jgi:pimeloyl-ACP methyl ester carboxylesterase